MPGFRWTDDELKELKLLRKGGWSVTEILEDPDCLPGKTKDALQQQCRRSGWVNNSASEACKKAKEETLTPKQTRMFCAFLRQNPRAPLEEYETVWNPWAVERGLPKISQGMAYYWLTKMGFERSQQESYKSSFSKKKRRRNKQVRFKERFVEVGARCALELEHLKQDAKTFRKRHKSVKSCKCGFCDNRWPLSKRYFNALPSSFTFGNKRLKGLQTEFCKYCDTTMKWMLTLYRAYDRDDTFLVEERKAQRRAGLDKAVKAMIDEEKKKCKKHFKKHGTDGACKCVRCGVPWPLDKNYFRENRGTKEGEKTYRVLCVFCDAEYERCIDRLKRDRKDCRELTEDRDEYLWCAREKQRKQRRKDARKRRLQIRDQNPDFELVRCRTCREWWHCNVEVAIEFWHVGTYRRANGMQMIYIGTKACNFCKSDREAENRRAQKRKRSS